MRNGSVIGRHLARYSTIAQHSRKHNNKPTTEHRNSSDAEHFRQLVHDDTDDDDDAPLKRPHASDGFAFYAPKIP